MTTGRDDTGTYSLATRFGKGKRLYHDKKWRRPATVSEMLHQIEATRLGNGWDWREFARNCLTLDLPVGEIKDFSPAKLRAFSPDQLMMILDDFEKYRMILYES